MKQIIALFGGTLLIVLMVATMGSITDFRSDSDTVEYNTTTVVGQTSANVTLPLAVLDDSLINVTSVTSNTTTDAPIAAVLTSKVLGVTGLTASKTIRLTVIYRAKALEDYTGVDLAAKWWPLFLTFAVIAVIVGAIYTAYVNK